MKAILQIQEILAARGVTLHRVSRRSADLFGGSSPFYVPHNLYHRLSHASFRPTIHQVLALSHISGYQLCDWLAVFGFDLDAISRAQLLVPRRRTTVLDSAVYDKSRRVPWFAERAGNETGSSTTPLGQFVRWGETCRIVDLLAPDAHRFVYVRVGEDDIYARPQFARGSILRADTTRANGFAIEEANASGSRFFLVEHRSGWTCARLIPVAKNRVVLDCPLHPCAERELRLEKDIRVIGIIDAEIRPLARRETERHPASLLLPNAELTQSANAPASLRQLLSQSRRRAGLAYREASSLSRLIATILSDPEYFAAPSTLSDYETLDAPPRHIQKILTVCLLYGIAFPSFLTACGLPLSCAGHDPMPDRLKPHLSLAPTYGSSCATAGRPESQGFLSSLLHQWHEVPLFLRASLDAITGMKKLGLSDVFWVAGNERSDPLLQKGALAVVNRRAKRPRTFDPSTACKLPLYLLLKRDGGYVCGRCTLDRNIVRIHSSARRGQETQQFRNGVDVDIVGEITTIARLL